MFGKVPPSGAGGAGGGGGGGGGGGRREGGTGDTIFWGSSGGTEPLTMVTMVVVAVAVDGQWQYWQCRSSVAGAH